MRHFRDAKDIEAELAELYRTHGATIVESGGQRFARFETECACGTVELNEWPLTEMAIVIERRLSASPLISTNTMERKAP
jgi:hypothetical protein